MCHLKQVFSFFFPLLLVHITAISAISAEEMAIKESYQLSISFNLEDHLLEGTAKITIAPEHALTLNLNRLTITGILLKDSSKGKKDLQPINNRLVIPATDKPKELYISYTRIISNSLENLVSPQGISLLSNWYPIADVRTKFHLTASLPQGFTAITEADQFPLQKSGNITTATFSTPTRTLHFIAGPYSHKERNIRKELSVHTLFFPEDKNLVDEYLEAADHFLERYEKEIGPFPYGHYVIAANRLPTGFSFPGFTLIGQTVLRLPFIKETSLGHEILHSWFGNSVDVDYARGNWCEGLTSYLADYSYRAEKGEGWQARKEAIITYLSYVHDDTVIPLQEFDSASHNQQFARTRRAVGYTRGALLFHELREKLGTQPFNRAIRLFYTDNRGKKASWDDLQNSFETASGQKLDNFFNERLQRTEIPSLQVNDAGIDSVENKPVLSFTLLQLTESPFSLLVPIYIKTINGTIIHNQFINQKENHISIPLNSRPLEFTLDPEYSLLRKLSPAEMVPVWSRFMGSDSRLIILASEKDRVTFDSMLKSFRSNGANIKLSADVTNQELSENSLLFLGAAQGPALSLFADPDHSTKGFTLDVRINPLNPDHVAVLVTSSNQAETQAVARRLNHYGKYSFLHFLQGRNLQKSIAPSPSGIRVVLETLPAGGKTSELSSFDKIINELNDSRVVYVGETHTSWDDHLLQLRIIEALYEKNHDLSIGMEMFPTASQPALDQYILSGENIDEKTFLKDSGYFNVWRYDYRFFRDIINFAKRNKIPVIGLNLDKEIVSDVFRFGNTDNLKEDTLKTLPIERDLDLPGYRERLFFMNGVHKEGGHGQGKMSGFIQAQGLWDETMAENIAGYLKKNPTRKMVVLAGTQHSRKDSGIPPRVSRRLQIKQSSVLNIYDSAEPAKLGSIADFFFLATAQDLPAAPKIGIVLTPVVNNEEKFLKISQISPHGKAGEAGLISGDILTMVNNSPVNEMADLRIALLNARAGETIEIKIIRQEKNTQAEKTFLVELSSPQPPMMHP